jgi:serine/threonine protein kinase
MQVARAMRYLHSRGVSHGDLKPLNILWKARKMDGPMGDGYVNVKVVDFGLAKLNDYKHQASIGSTTYRAPEVMVDGKTIRPDEEFAPKVAADVYSFAIVCSEILTGKLPFAETEWEYDRRKMHEPEPGFLPQELCPKYLRSCLLKCWDLEPTRRPSFPQICEVLLHAQNNILGLKHNVQCLSIG